MFMSGLNIGFNLGKTLTFHPQASLLTFTTGVGDDMKEDITGLNNGSHSHG